MAKVTEVRKISQRLAEAKYRKTEKGKLAAKRKRAKYRKTEKGKLAIKGQNARWLKNEKGKLCSARRRIRDREKNRQRDILYNAIRVGRVIRPESCSESECDGKGNIEAHHEDYNQPLVVIWLCRSCHRLRHH